MKPFKRHNKRLLIMIAMSITCACASTAYAEINERPGPDATYDDKVVLDSEWQIYNNEYAGAEKEMLVCQTYVTPCLMKSWSVSLGDFHPSGSIGKRL